VFFGLFYHNSFNIPKEYPDYLLLLALPQLLLVQIDGFCRLNVARPKLRRSKVYGNSIFRRDLKKLILSKRTEQIESQNN
jgi:hypothetical protein